VRVPLWHPYLRTAALLRLSRQAAVDLMLLVDSLAEKRVAELAHDHFIGPAAEDLAHSVAVLESFTDPPGRTDPFAVDVQVIRGYLSEVIGELEKLNGIRGTLRDPHSPLRAMFALATSEILTDCVGRIGARVVMSFEEGSREERLVENLPWALAAGVVCDLSLIAQQLRAAAANLVNITPWQGEKVEGLASIVERQGERLREFLPLLQEGWEGDTLVDVPIPGQSAALEEDGEEEGGEAS